MLHTFVPRSRSFVFVSLLLASACEGDGGTRAPDAGLDSGLVVDSGGDAGGDADAGDAGPDALEVRGAIVDRITGRPVAGASVFVGDASGVVSDASGKFRVSGVTLPYDVSIRATGAREIVEFRGLHATEPVLSVDGPPPMHTADVSGHARFADAATATDRLSCFLAGTNALAGFTRVTGGTGTSIAWNLSGGGLYDYPARWWGPTTAEGTAHCFLDRFAGGALVASWRGSVALTLAKDGAFANRDLDLASAPLATVTGTVTDPLGEASVTIAVGPSVANGNGYFASDAPQALGAFSRVVPYAPGGDLAIVVADATMTRRAMDIVRADATVSVDLALLSRPTLVSPEADAAGVEPSAPLVFHGGRGHVFLVVLWTDDGTTVRTYTTSESLVPSDLARFGLAYPAGGPARVLVVEYDAPSVDAIANTDGAARWIAQRGRMQSAGTEAHRFTFAN